MYNRLIFVFLCFFLASCKSQQKNNFPNPVFENQRVLILGDSITQAGLYVSFLEYELNKLNPQSTYDIISIGLSSETASGLSEKEHPFPRPCIHERLDRALTLIKPSVVFACYGMNDGIYHPQSPERFAAYKSGLLNLSSKVQASGARLILLTPPYFDKLKKGTTQGPKGDNYSYKKPYSNYNQVLRDYGQWIQRASDLPFIDLNLPMLNMTKIIQEHDPKSSLTKDGIHPNEIGHFLMAQTILTELKILSKGALAKANVSQIMQDPLFKLVHQSRQARSKGWLNYVGYTRGKTVKSRSIDATEVKVQELQKQIKSL